MMLLCVLWGVETSGPVLWRVTQPPHFHSSVFYWITLGGHSPISFLWTLSRDSGPCKLHSNKSTKQNVLVEKQCLGNFDEACFSERVWHSCCLANRTKETKKINCLLLLPVWTLAFVFRSRLDKTDQAGSRCGKSEIIKLKKKIANGSENHSRDVLDMGT